jgi:hypothetical protein
MRLILKLVLLAGALYAAKRVYDTFIASQPVTPPARGPRDTPTGTDPRAKYSEPGYEDKSFGQAVAQDQALVDRLVRETGGDFSEADARFRRESAGAPVLARQDRDDT